MSPQVKRIGMLLYDDCDLLDFAGPAAVFHSAARHLIRTGQTEDLTYVVETFSISGGIVRTLQGIGVETSRAPELVAGSMDTLLVVGGFDDHKSCDPAILDFIADSRNKVRRIASVCCGAFLLGGAGLLNGRRATTHWEDCDRLQKDFPDVEVCPDAIFVRDDNIWTSAGITSGIDLGLALVEEDHGHALALLVARNLVVFYQRPGGQSQFSASLQSQATQGPLASLLTWIIENPREDLRAEALAERSNMSLRNFFRAFEVATSTSPAHWVEMTRVEIAKRYLEQSLEKVGQVADKAGFASEAQLRKAFARRTGVTPTQYRARFARPRTEIPDASTYTHFFDRYIRVDVGTDLSKV